MKFTRMIHVVDVWAAGGPHRIVTGGLLPIPGRTLEAKKNFILERFPDLPRLLTAAQGDPDAMVAAILTEPCDAFADLGVLWVGCGAFINLCGTGTFALGTVLCATGMVPSDGPVSLTIEIPAGLQHLSIEVADGEAKSVAASAPASWYHGDHRVHVPGFGDVPVALAYGINCLEPLIDCAAIGIDLVPENVDRLVQLARRIKLVLGDPGQFDAAHMTGVQLSYYQDNPPDTGADFRCMAIVGNGSVDQTPSGTSTCAHLAMRFARGLLKVNEPINVESINGGRLSGRVVAETRIEGRQAVIPEIRGTATIRRFQTIIA